MGNKLTSFLELPDSIKPYLIESNKSITDRLISDKTFNGITITSSGFYGPQGRKLRLKTHTEELQIKLGQYKSHISVLNFEMESSALFALGRELGHRCATICLGVANRPNMEFSKGYQNEMENLILHTLDRI
jgi:uridine phosphorylase